MHRSSFDSFATYEQLGAMRDVYVCGLSKCQWRCRRRSVMAVGAILFNRCSLFEFTQS
jgi:hypothetical protein